MLRVPIQGVYSTYAYLCQVHVSNKSLSIAFMELNNIRLGYEADGANGQSSAQLRSK